MSLQSLLGEVPSARFVAGYYQKLPYSAAGLARPLCDLATHETLARLVADQSADLLVCRRNEQRTGASPKNAHDIGQLLAEGWTLLVRHAERHDPRLTELAAAFERDFAAPVNVHLYCTPGGEHGFGWHYDAEEVFIVQTTGRKEYSLRKNTVNPWPIEETLPADMRYEREIMPLVKCELAAGDWLYIPSGYWHKAESRETALSLAIGVQPRTGVELFDELRPRIVESLLWRQRLPVAGAAAAESPEALAVRYAEICQQLAADFTQLMTDPRFVEQVLRKDYPAGSSAGLPADRPSSA